MKEIHFFADNIGLGTHRYVTDYTNTSKFISRGEELIHTTSMAHLSFDLLDQGYRIFVHKNSKGVEFKPGMDNPSGKDIRREHNILRLFLSGFFDEMFN